MSKPLTSDDRKFWASKLGMSEQYLYQCLTGRRDMGPAEARRLEQESGGALTRQMLCQRTWRGIWPELAAAQAQQPVEHRSQSARRTETASPYDHTDLDRRDEEGATHLRRQSNGLDCPPTTQGV